MWKRILDTLRCPGCQGALDLIPLDYHSIKLERKHFAKAETLGIHSNELNEYVEAGVLLSRHCKYWYPILHGLPVLLLYETSVTREFLAKHRIALKKYASGYTFPKEKPKPGEQSLLSSFSKEWTDYDYDGVVWGSSYGEREETFIAEMGFGRGELSGAKFLEIGCGLGLTTNSAAESYGGDAVGVDLSAAALRATKYYATNPFVHFIQASLFDLPVRRNYFDLVYSHGVLHHTYSTKEALRAVSEYVKPNGSIYTWVYGRGGQTNSWDRRLGHYAEVLLRPVVSRAPTSVATIVLVPIALGYVFLSLVFRLTRQEVIPYNFKRALHAARDRFTPRFAFRQDFEEVKEWLEQFGFEKIESLDWRVVPPGVQAMFRGATAVRAKRRLL